MMKNKKMIQKVRNNKKKILSIFVGLLTISFICVFLFNSISYASWVEEEDGIKYIQEDGQYAVGFVDIDGQRYYFDSDGHLVYGKFYVEDEDCYYYSNEEGIVQYGAIQTEQDFYIADNTGRLATGFVEFDGYRYYFNQICQLVVGWFKHEDNWYYSDSTGKIMTGFVTVDGYRYYLNPDGSRIKDTIFDIDGITYIFNADGSVDENATALYPVFQQINSIRAQKDLPALVLNDKVQACAIVRAAELENGFSVDSIIPMEQLLANRGVQAEGGYEFAYGGVEGYDIEQLILNMKKDVNFMKVLSDKNITEVGLGVHQKDNIFYYDIIFITKAN